MKIKQAYLKGKSIFIISLFVIGITILTVYLTGKNYNRTVTSNLYISLSIIGTILFFFMTYGLYKGIRLTNNFPKFKNVKTKNWITQSEALPNLSDISIGDEIGGIIISILLWIGMTIFVFILLIVLEIIFLFSVFILLAMLYWIFFRGLKFILSKSNKTKGNLTLSVIYSLLYTSLSISWIFGIVYLNEIFS